MKTMQSIFTCALAFLALWLASLACGDMYGEIDPTKIAPQDLSNMDLSSRRMIGFDFSNKNLSGVNFSHANIEDANFTNSNCAGAVFDGTQFLGAIFSGAILDKKWALIIDVLTSGSGANKNLAGYDFSEAYLVEYDFSGSNLQGANFHNTNLVGDFRGADLSGADFSGTDLSCGRLCTDFSYANLTNANISSEQMEQVILGCTKLPDGTVAEEKLCTDHLPTP